MPARRRLPVCKPLFVVTAIALAACGGAESDETKGGGSVGDGGAGHIGGPNVTVSSEPIAVTGTVVDFVTGLPVESSATVTTDGLEPPPTVSVTGAAFEIRGIAPFSVFHLLSGAPPTHRSTFHAGIEVTDDDVSGLSVEAVSETFLAELQQDLDVSPTPGTGIVIARAVGEDGAPATGIPASAFALNDGAPPTEAVFLDQDKQGAPALDETSDSAYVVFFDVPPGPVSVAAAEGSDYTMVSALAPVAANVVTLVDVRVSAGALPLPDYASFEEDVLPILQGRGCIACHHGDSPGADLGGLQVNGGAEKVHRELTEETSPNHATLRVNVDEPEKSILLRFPSYEDPPDAHPNVTFASSSDPDYLMILKWIEMGAPQN